MDLPGYINKLAKEAALGAVNITSDVLQQQITAKSNANGFMTIVGIINNTDGSTNLIVADSNNNQQNVVYLGSSQIYLGKPVFVNNGYVQ